MIAIKVIVAEKHLESDAWCAGASIQATSYRPRRVIVTEQ